MIATTTDDQLKLNNIRNDSNNGVYSPATSIRHEWEMVIPRFECPNPIMT